MAIAPVGDKSVLLNIIRGVVIHPKTGEKITINCLFDNCCQMSSIRTDVFHKLALPHLGMHEENVSNYGGKPPEHHLHIQTRVPIQTNEGLVNVDCWAIDCIVTPIQIKEWGAAKAIFPDIDLPQLDNVGRKDYKVDLLIGQDAGPAFIKCNSIKRMGLLAEETSLGWVVSGRLPTAHDIKPPWIAMVAQGLQENTDQVKPVAGKVPKQEEGLTEGEFLSMLDKDTFEQGAESKLLKLQLENMLDPTEFEVDENKKKSDMLQTFATNLRWVNGKYSVKLNWREKHPKLNSNYNLAKSFLVHGTKKMLRDGTYPAYKAIVDKNINKGVYKKYPHNMYEGHHIPHFGVLQPNSSTTPLRMVFSCCTGHPSINECILPGVSLLNDLPSLIRMVRTYPIAFTGDISAAYNAIALNEEDLIWTKFIFWKDEPFGEIVSYVQSSVGIGFIDSSFNYMATVITHLNNHENGFAQEIPPHMYSDNYLDGGENREIALKKIKESIQIFKDGGFVLRKFTSQDPEIRSQLKENNILDETDTPSLLGMTWILKDDTLMYRIPNKPINKWSKRTILRYSASFFDPCGFLSCISVNSVNFLGQLWEHNYSWDEEISLTHKVIWEQIKNDYETAAQVKIPRLHNFDKMKPIQLHVLTDSSNKAHGVNAYLVQGEQSVLVGAKFKLPAKKTRKTITTPEAELAAMALGAVLAEKLINTYLPHYPNLSTLMWTDSTIALGQLHGCEKQKVFVQNRISKIRRLIPNIPWRHLSSQENAADLTSRGLTGSEFLNSTLYWKGPKLLTLPQNYPEPYIHKDPGMKMLIGIKAPEQSLFAIMPPKNYKSLSRYRNVLQIVVKFISRLKREFPGQANLQQQVEILMVRNEQGQTMPKELEFLRTNTGPRPALIHPLKLYLDEDGIIRSGGRMQKAQIGAFARFPIFLTKNSPLIDLRVLEAHIGTCHGGQELTKVRLRNNFWVQNITTKIKKIIKTCYACKRASGPPFRKPTVPALPEHRITFKPYNILGIDATGHVWLKNDSTGNKEKYWIIILCCANIRHINLELVPDLTTQSILDTLKVHSSIYGAPKVIMADNASYFKSTEGVLTQELGKQNIKFLYSPVRAPWYGATWERLISIFKSLIRRTILKRLLRAREMTILLKEISQIVNSRPLTVASNDIRDDLPLTPNKLLFGRDIFPLSQGRHDESSADISYTPLTDQEVMKHWRLHDSLIREFKERFNTEYLGVLRQRHVYDHTQGPLVKADIEVGDLVLMKGDDHRMLWQTAEVIELMKGIDEEVRAVKLRGINGITNRAICHLYPLVKSHVLHPQTGNTKEPLEGEPPTPDPENLIDLSDNSLDKDLGQGRRPKRAAARLAEIRMEEMKPYL